MSKSGIPDGLLWYTCVLWILYRRVCRAPPFSTRPLRSLRLVGRDVAVPPTSRAVADPPRSLHWVESLRTPGRLEPLAYVLGERPMSAMRFEVEASTSRFELMGANRWARAGHQMINIQRDA